MAPLESFLAKRLRLTVNRAKSAVARPWDRVFLGYSVTTHKTPKLKVAPKSLKRLKDELRPVLRRGRGKTVRQTVTELTSKQRGWVAYFQMTEVKSSRETVDVWLRRKPRPILWTQWKRPRTRLRELVGRGIDHDRAAASAGNGRGGGWNAGVSLRNAAVSASGSRQQGLLGLLDEYHRLGA